jgi:diguanylate cyclase (GGDEF)-like protein/PAS domain S-box-containing protein
MSQTPPSIRLVPPKSMGDPSRAPATVAPAEAPPVLPAIFTALPIPVFAKDTEGRYIACNQAFTSLLGLSTEDLLGKSVFDVAPQELAIRYHRADLALMQEGGVQTYENQVQVSDGSIAQVIYHKAVFYLEDGQPGGIVGTVTDITAKRQAEKTLLQEASFDSLTGLINRPQLEKRLQLCLSDHTQLPLAILSIDLDRFKMVNETLGHALANRLLQAVAQKLAEAMRDCDLLSRSSRDEFILVLPQLIHRQYVDYLITRILTLLAAPFDLEGHQLYCSLSIGVSLAPEDGLSAAELLQKAETALFQAKSRGKNQCRFYDQGMEAETAERLALESALRGALQRQEIELHYQPQVDLQSGRITGVEALARWQHEEWGAVSPAKFIPVAEDSGLIIPLGNWVLHTACRQVKLWQAKGLPPVRVAVNVSGQQFQQTGFVDTVASALLESGLDPAWLELELTESTIMERTEENISTLQRLKSLGVQLTIDDFGTGYSSLSYLKRFPIDRIKIDRSFIMNLPGDADDAAITDAVIALAHSLRYKVVAEGVETAEQLAYLRSRQCDEFQGFLFGRPMPPTELIPLLKWGKPLP